LLRAEVLQPQGIRCIIWPVVRQGLRRRNRAEQAAEIPGMTDALQCACWHRPQPGAVNAAYGLLVPGSCCRSERSAFGLSAVASILSLAADVVAGQG